MADCPTCEYNKKRAHNWRVEAYRLAGHPLPEPEWVGLTTEDIKVIEDNAPSKQMAILMTEATRKEKNT